MYRSLILLFQQTTESDRKSKGLVILGPCQRYRKKLWSMKVIVMSVVVGAGRTVLKFFEKKLVEFGPKGKIETIHTTA